jgi:predicted permease
MRGLISHLRYAVRRLLKSPGFTVTSILILGFGIGLNTAVFSLINSVILRPLAFPHSEQLAELFMPLQNDEYMPFDYQDFTDICAAQRSFESLAIFISEDENLTGQGAAERIDGSYVSANMFKLTGMPFVLGRPFSADEDRSGGPHVVVLSERLWKRRFNADPKIIGAMLTISGRPLEVIGVAPAQAFEWGPVDVYIPMHLGRRLDFQSRAQHYFNCIGRLHRGVSPSKAQMELESIQGDLAKQYPDTDKGYRIRVAPLLSVQTELFSPTLWLLGAAVGCLFLIAVENIVSLVLARAFERRREISIRAALGASRRRIVGELLIEGALLSSLEVSQRTREIGVRIALGAQAANILKLVVRHGLKIFGAGLAIGILSTFVLSRYLQGLLFGVSSNDPISFGLAILVLSVTGLLACLLPAFRAMRTDPIIVLRE